MTYRVDLKSFMARCEANYHRLCQIFPNMAVEERRCLGLTGSDNREVVLSVTERTPYTTLLRVEEHGKPGSCPNSGASWSKPPILTVRMYHDAKLAEVVDCDGMRGVRPKNPYPNKNMLQRDEKAQWNCFLEEWLAVCMEHAYVSEPASLSFSGDVD